jgi:hypothetical protein
MRRQRPSHSGEREAEKNQGTRYVDGDTTLELDPPTQAIRTSAHESKKKYPDGNVPNSYPKKL